MLSMVLVAIIVVSRIAAFPASIWEQDEAYLAAGVSAFEPAANHPHPPWFPLWLVLGKIAASFGLEAATSLRVLSAVFSVMMIFPLVALWSQILEDQLAVAAAVVYLFLPGSWLLAGRAFTGTAATTLMVGALAVWLGRDGSVPTSRSVIGALLAAGAILVRPHFFPLIAGVLVVLLLQKKLRLIPAVEPIVAAGLMAGVGLVAASGGVNPLIVALRKHAAYHFGQLPNASFHLETFGLGRYLGNGWLAIPWRRLSSIVISH